MTHATPSRRAVIRTAAWSVPAVTVAAAAPAFAASLVPNLSTSTLNTTPASRNGNAVTIPPILIRNSGTGPTDNITFTFTTTGTINQAQIVVPFTPLPTDFGAMGMTTAPTPALPTGTFTSTFLQFADIAAGGAMSPVASILLTFADATPVDITITAIPANGGVGWTSSTFTV